MFFKNKRVLVTGGAGVIGKELIKMLQEQGAIIRCVDFVEKPDELEGVDYLKLDLADERSQILFRFDPEYVFHLAADFERSTESRQFWESNFQNNVVASHNLLNQIITLPNLKKIIFASSYLVYDTRLYTDTSQENKLHEDSRMRPRNLCGVAKLQTEMDIEFLADFHGVEHASARIFRVYGKGSRDVISRWVRSILRKEEITVFSEYNRFDYIFARDVAIGLLKLGESKGANGVFNLGYGRSRKVADVVQILQNHFGDIKIKRTDDVILPEASCGDVTKLHNTVGWRPEISLENGIAEIIEFEQNALRNKTN